VSFVSVNEIVDEALNKRQLVCQIDKSLEIWLRSRMSSSSAKRDKLQIMMISIDKIYFASVYSVYMCVF
jgi:hypothetical protein